MELEKQRRSMETIDFDRFTHATLFVYKFDSHIGKEGFCQTAHVAFVARSEQN